MDTILSLTLQPRQAAPAGGLRPDPLHDHGDQDRARRGCDGVHLELAGDLARILHLCSTSNMQNAQAVAGSGRLRSFAYELSVVAGRGFEPLTFRL
jgi:hypothetical protein